MNLTSIKVLLLLAFGKKADCLAANTHTHIDTTHTHTSQAHAHIICTHANAWTLMVYQSGRL